MIGNFGTSAWSNLLLAQGESRTTIELSRLQSYGERWHYLLLVGACALILAFVAWMYRRDTRELRRGVAWLLLTLRLVALAGLLAFYLHLEKRTEPQVTHNSRVILLVDTSLSMGLHDTDTSNVPATPTRLQEVVQLLDKEGLISELRKRHDVILTRFDADHGRVAAFAKLPAATTNGSITGSDPAPEAAIATKPAEPIDWQKALLPQGPETRLGRALRQVISEERASPLAAVVVLTDGGQNAGADPSAAVAAAREAKVPVFTVGIGSNKLPTNVRVSDLVAPARAYPEDSFTVTGYLQSQGFASRTLTVELWSRAGGDGANKNDPGKIEGTERVTLGKAGEVMPVRFTVTPHETGRRTFRLLVKPPTEDSDESDNQQEADIEIVDRKTKVLLVASGPTREYNFLRNQLQRDKQMVVDVWLQSAPATGVSQDAHAILTEFPASAQELFEYDCVIGFDPAWQLLEAEQVELLERWVAEKAGGLIVLAGPVEMDQWAGESSLSKLRAMYPVEFHRRLSLLEDGRFGSQVAWPLEFTREGLEAEFLWLGESASASQAIWARFPGVFGYYAVKGAKPGATVYARYSDPETAAGSQLPVYMAGQFYGSGRVFYLGSGEMWRLRALDDAYFEQVYTKLIRHVTQGRLLIGSSRGMLLVDRDRYLLGNTVAVRAQLSDPQFQPLDAPRVPLVIVQPDTTPQTIELEADPQRKGMFAGQFSALQEGTYRLELAIPDSENQQLSRRIQVKVPDLERENPQRNDALLAEIAERTGGQYYVGTAAVLGKGLPPLASRLKDRTETTYLPGIVDRKFEEQWMQSLLVIICGALCCEWLVRRLAKLA